MKPPKKIELNDLPELGHETGIFAFAMTFDGYEAFGSFDEAAKSACQRKRELLEDFRTNSSWRRVRLGIATQKSIWQSTKNYCRI